MSLSSGKKHATDPNKPHQRHDPQEPFDCFKQKKNSKGRPKVLSVGRHLKGYFQSKAMQIICKNLPR